MTQAAPLEDDAPVWAREDAFPKAPSGYGWLGLRGKSNICQSADELIEAIRNDQDATVLLVWTPQHSHMILPEELEGASEANLVSRRRRAAEAMADSQDKLRWFGWLLAGLTVIMLYQGMAYAPRTATPLESLWFAFQATYRSMAMGVALLMFLIFAFIPWYQTRKSLRELAADDPHDMVSRLPLLRFETWLDIQKAPVTRLLLILTALVGVAQLMPGDGISAAGLLKPYDRQGEWWRLFTAPMLHGNPLHFLMNASALIYLGRRIEVFARWPHLPLVFLFSACVGGEASALLVPVTSVGASGGLMGWLGFLLVFESLHGRLVPRKARRRLLAGVFLTALIGLIGYRFIDNAAHLGGLLAGMLYAVIVFPKSYSPSRPNSTLPDLVAGGLALTVLTASAAFAVMKILNA